MTLLVTGGTGFVLSHVVRQWLEQDEGREAIVVDRAGFDASAEVFFAPVRERMRVIPADVVDTPSWTAEVDPSEVTELVNGAALSPITNDPALSPDRDTPAETVRVNIMGATRVFDWARTLPNLRRLIYMSSGVYGYGAKGDPGGSAGDSDRRGGAARARRGALRHQQGDRRAHREALRRRLRTLLRLGAAFRGLRPDGPAQQRAPSASPALAHGAPGGGGGVALGQQPRGLLRLGLRPRRRARHPLPAEGPGTSAHGVQHRLRAAGERGRSAGGRTGRGTRFRC